MALRPRAPREALGDQGAAPQYTATLANLTRAINEQLWNDTLHTYSLSLDSFSNYSLTAIAWTIHSGAANSSQAASSIAKLDELRCGVGYKLGSGDICSDSYEISPNTNGFLLDSLSKAHRDLDAFKRARSFFDTSAMQPILLEQYMPGANVTSDDQILQYIMASSYQNWHASCTCRMGRENDSMAVVDSHARVIGVEGLRVVDASAFALLPPGHPESTVYVLAEKIAAEILGTC
ncbi:hypothetical protein LTR56_017305 [Elasticomyces elasticus]|nr:hypothetical protein LTR56_017305 [Elasticomyces elasticus]KAK3639393.1 hypothetical protein LTR22_017427 [Elasticomyces elasticus]KAK4924578.1 hypothetical protein LTR49_008261 [Elasticomyces elasticus]KAK5763072.1 hypothetical protein LTS12_006856 [Elasticomyces elasticus]